MGSRRIAKTRSLSSYLSSVNSASSTALIKTSTANEFASNSLSEGALSEDFTIMDKSIQSGNYLEGYSGWKITGSGNAEFGNVVVRGDINASSGSIGYWNISAPAVSRVVGSTTLLGTFLESSISGSNDLDVTSGTYVGLFKSYVGTPVQITEKSRSSNVATLTVLDHQFEVGDVVNIVVDSTDADDTETPEDTDLAFTNSTATVTGVTFTTISYANVGDDLELTEAVGSVTLVNEDVAGLYLRDYSKSKFDYGYFSNKGVAYVSPEDVNLVHNPSFESWTV